MGNVKKPTMAKSAKPVTVKIANQHTGPIMFPRRGAAGQLQLPPLVLQPGTVTEIDAVEWKERCKNRVVQHYLDRHLLAQVRKKGPVPVTDSTSTDLPIPAHLLSDEEELQGAEAPVKARVRRTNVSKVQVG